MKLGHREAFFSVLDEEGMFPCLPVGSRAPIYLPSSDKFSFEDRITSRTYKRDASPPPPRPPPPPGYETETDMPRVRHKQFVLS